MLPRCSPLVDNAAAIGEPKALGALVKRILVVDDDPDILDALRQALEDGYEVLVAQNGREALDILAREAVDAIVLDLMMPVLDGVAVLQQLRSGGSTTPVIIVSAGADVARVARTHGIRDYFPKPFDLSALEQALARLVGGGGRGPGGTTSKGGSGGGDASKRDRTHGFRSRVD